jgi:endonuclease/exonuclease/phosphatase family metal-dependent hydrolase
MVVRTWNVFHGNASPPRRHAYLCEMVELVTADRPAVVCLQEVPVSALSHLERWSGMRVSGAVAARPRLRSAELGRLITGVHHGFLRSALSGQANAILVDRAFEDEHAVVVSTSGERRVCQSLRLVDGVAVANFHLTTSEAQPQFERVLDAVEGLGERVILAGDANLRPDAGGAYERLHALGFSQPLADSIDQVVVRGLPATPPVAWPQTKRRLDGLVLSDHTPVELSVG